jgi:hypothetical protein
MTANAKKLTIFGTRHYTASRLDLAIRAAMEQLIDKTSPTIGLEEWSVSQIERSGFHVVCESRNVPWASIGTPPLDDLTGFDYTYSLDFPRSANVQQHGPFDVHERREHLMCSNILGVMSSHDSALVVIGLAHLQSMCVKLDSNFDVRAYGYALELF